MKMDEIESRLDLLEKKVAVLEGENQQLREDLGEGASAGVGAYQAEYVPGETVGGEPAEVPYWVTLQKAADDARILASKNGQRINGSPAILTIHESTKTDA